MSWDQQAYSFGNPNAHPPTPTQTPTSGVFSSPAFLTPRVEATTFDDHTGWTPTFAEEYSVFNATPGRLTSAGSQFADISTPRPSTACSQREPLSSDPGFEAELTSHVHHSIQTDLPLPPVEPLRRLHSSPQDISLHGTGSVDKNSHVTPRKPRRRLEEAFSSQTATPPQSATKSSRKLAPKPQAGIMQARQDQLQMSPDMPGLSTHINFSTGSDDIFGYPMTVPATAPIFTNTKPFWDPDSSMSGMDMDFDFTAGSNPMFDPGLSHRVSSSDDWGGSNQVFQDAANLPTFNGDVQASGRQRSIISKNEASITDPILSDPNFRFGASAMSEDQFAIVSSNGAVDPGLLFTFPELTTSTFTGPEVDSPVYSQLPPGQMVRKPYEHQQRESMKDQEDLRRSRSGREASTEGRHEKGSFSSPTKKSGRSGLQRSASDSRTKLGPARRSGQLSKSSSRPSTAEMRENPIRRRTSPLKHQSRVSLSSIPESVSGTRTALTFSIDANGRARTETKIIVEDPVTIKRRTSSPPSDGWSSSEHSESSSDEDPIILPSRNTSFSLPPKSSNQPKIGRFDTSRQFVEERRQSINMPQWSFNASDSFSRTTEGDEQESEAETVMEEYDASGDAVAALRKVMENRKQDTTQQGSSKKQSNSGKSNRGNGASHSTSRKISQQYSDSTSSTNLSPTTVSDPDLATPSTDRTSSRSESTRCICNNREGDGFMIQCESCEKWLHAKCVGISRHRLPKVYICAFCAQTPNMRGGRIREPVKGSHQVGSSPLAHKSFKSWR